jgi:general secretion pathway protein G
MVGVVILGLLAALTAPQVFSRISEAKIVTTREQLDLLGAALDRYRLDNGSYPTTEQGLPALREKPTRDPSPPNWRGPYLQHDLSVDSWGRPFIYRSPGVRNPAGYDLQSLGRDGALGGRAGNRDLIGR